MIGHGREPDHRHTERAQALADYHNAKTPAEERDAYQRMRVLGFPPLPSPTALKPAAPQRRIPFEGPVGSGPFPSGPLQIGNDWPGCFIRGDEAMGFESAIRRALGMLPEPAAGDVWASLYHPRRALERLADLLNSAVLKE